MWILIRLLLQLLLSSVQTSHTQTALLKRLWNITVPNGAPGRWISPQRGWMITTPDWFLSRNRATWNGLCMASLDSQVLEYNSVSGHLCFYYFCIIWRMRVDSSADKTETKASFFPVPPHSLHNANLQPFSTQLTSSDSFSPRWLLGTNIWARGGWPHGTMALPDDCNDSNATQMMQKCIV